MKNQELEEKFAEQLKSGNLFIFAYGEVQSSGYQAIYFAQKRSDLKGSGGADDWDAELRGWNNDRIVRTIQSMNVKEIGTRTKEQQQALKAKFKIGNLFPERSIQVVHNFTPAYDSQEPRKTPAGDVLMKDGKPIYEHTKIVLNENLQDVLIVADKVNAKMAIPVGTEEFAGFN